MSDAKAQVRERAIAYMVRLLQMDPFHEGEAIIETRSAALRLTKKNNAAEISQEELSQPRDKRRKLLERLARVRAEFWTLSLADLHSRLAALDSREFPDLEAALARLRVVAAHRSEFPKLAELRGFDGEFFSAFKQVLTKSPRDVAVLKEQVLSSFRNRAHRNRGRRMVQLLKKQLPAIYQLEAEWLDALCRQKTKAADVVISAPEPSSWFGFGGSSWVYGIIIIVALRILVRLFVDK